MTALAQYRNRAEAVDVWRALHYNVSGESHAGRHQGGRVARGQVVSQLSARFRIGTPENRSVAQIDLGRIFQMMIRFPASSRWIRLMTLFGRARVLRT